MSKIKCTREKPQRHNQNSHFVPNTFWSWHAVAYTYATRFDKCERDAIKKRSVNVQKKKKSTITQATNIQTKKKRTHCTKKNSQCNTGTNDPTKAIETIQRSEKEKNKQTIGSTRTMLKRKKKHTNDRRKKKLMKCLPFGSWFCVIWTLQMRIKAIFILFAKFVVRVFVHFNRNDPRLDICSFAFHLVSRDAWILLTCACYIYFERILIHLLASVDAHCITIVDIFDVIQFFFSGSMWTFAILAEYLAAPC